MPSLRRAVVPTARPVAKSAFLKPATPLRSFSSTPAQNATLNQVLKVRFSRSRNSSLHILTVFPPGLPQTPPSPPRRLARPGRRPRPAAQGRVHQGRHHAAQEAQLGRAEDGACAPDHRQDYHGLHPRRGPQHPAAQRGPGQGRQGAGLSRCAVQAGPGRAGSGRRDEQDERPEQVRHQKAQEGESELRLVEKSVGQESRASLASGGDHMTL